MEYRIFGRTGVKISPLTLGCMMFGGKTNLEDTCRIIDHALEAGLNCIDTANIYSRGKSEEFTGEALKRNGLRDRVFLCTKVHGAMDADDPNMRGNTRRHIIQQCEASLRRLQTDYIDLYQIHRPQPEVPIDETLRALDDLVRAGKVRYTGTSTFAAWQFLESLWCAKELHLNRFVSEQPPYNLLDRRIERELLPMCRSYSIATLPWSPLASGMLSGKYRAGQPAPEGSRFAETDKSPFLAQRWNDGALNVVEKLLPLAESKGVTLSQFALAWTLQQPGITSPIIGPRTLDQLVDNLKSLDVKLTAADLQAVDAIVPPGTHVSVYYDADFGPQPHRW
ncbi:MAG: aldo/keto reductase [Cephaloticoccus sp.]|nr:aldo/keto reductase [Cephaloticoccus sp.]MCF7760187.1 aldo/keto reductase [Cephaloticoccus sp.]